MKLNRKRLRGEERGTGTEGDRGAVVVMRGSRRTRRTTIAPIWRLQGCYSKFRVYSNCRHFFFDKDESENWNDDRTCGIFDTNTKKSFVRYGGTRLITVFGNDKVLEVPYWDNKRLTIMNFSDGKEEFLLRLSGEAERIYTGESEIYAAVQTSAFSLDVLNVKRRIIKKLLHFPSKCALSMFTVGEVLCMFPDLGSTVHSRNLVYYIADMAAPVEELNFRPICVSFGKKKLHTPILASTNKKFIYYCDEFNKNFVIFKTLCPEESIRQLDLKRLTIKDASRHVLVFAEDGKVFAILNNQDFAVYESRGGDPVNLFRLRPDGEENLIFTILNHCGDLILSSSGEEGKKKVCIYNVQVFLNLREKLPEPVISHIFEMLV